jgi:hypothetical protein
MRVPTFYVNITNNVTVDVLYTDSIPQPITIGLAYLPGITVYPSYVIRNATPNQVLHQSFAITSANTGTYLATLHISAGGASINSTIPIVVLPASQAPLPSPGLFELLVAFITSSEFYKGRLWVAAAILALIIILTYLLLRRRVVHSRRERTRNLMRLKEQMKRNR